VTSQTTISVNVAFDRIWMLAASMEHGDCLHFKMSLSYIYVCWHICMSYVGWQYAPTADRFRPSLPEYKQVSLWARAASILWPAHGMLTFSHAAVHAINKALFATSSFRSHSIIFYWNWCKAMFLFQLISVLLISITFYTYLANIVFCATWTLS